MDTDGSCHGANLTDNICKALAGLRHSAEGDHCVSLLDLKPLGVSTAKNQSLSDCFLTLRKDIEDKVRRIPQAKGGVRFSFDQKENPTLIVVIP